MNKNAFNGLISDYAFGRPGYPGELYKDIVEYSALQPEANILEIGSGPGQATGYFVENGYPVTGLEIGDKQVKYLQDKYKDYGNFSAICSPFEEYECADNTCDLIFSATAFHWIAPEIGYPKAYRLLKSNGALAVFWHMASIIRPRTELLDGIFDVVQQYAPELNDYISRDEAEELHKLRVSQIQVDGLFGEPEYRQYRREEEYSAERYARLMNSYSDIHEINEGRRETVIRRVAEYIERMGGKVIVPQEVWLYMARKA